MRNRSILTTGSLVRGPPHSSRCRTNESERSADISNPDFPGIYSFGEAFIGPRPNTATHPHLKLDETMVSVPKVYPGDMVFWHCVRVLLVRVD